MALVVRDTVALAAGKEAEVDVCDWAQASAAIAKIKAIDKFFTVFSNPGEIVRFLILSMVRDMCRNGKDGKGWDFGNAAWILRVAEPCRAALDWTADCVGASFSSELSSL